MHLYYHGPSPGCSAAETSRSRTSSPAGSPIAFSCTTTLFNGESVSRRDYPYGGDGRNLSGWQLAVGYLARCQNTHGGQLAPQHRNAGGNGGANGR
jgi:hypothetical protein